MINIINWKHSKKQQEGVAIIEMVITLPLIILIFTISGEVGMLLNKQTTLSKTVETGARFLTTNTLLGTGLVKISAEKIQQTRNLILYGNLLGTGDILLTGMDATDINVQCTYGTKNSYCDKDNRLSPITVSATYDYTPMFGSLFNNVTGFNLFPIQLTATSVIEPI